MLIERTLAHVEKRAEQPVALGSERARSATRVVRSIAPPLTSECIPSCGRAYLRGVIGAAEPRGPALALVFVAADRSLDLVEGHSLNWRGGRSAARPRVGYSRRQWP